MTRPILVTGASGALGRATVAALLERGQKVRALVRGGTLPDAPGLEIVRADLAIDPLAPVVAGVAAVIHTAAAVSGSDAEMERDTLRATERLVLAMRACDPQPFMVLAGSLSVYAAGPQNGLIEETSPLEGAPHRRDAYCRAKLAQERAAATSGPYWCLRLGALWGPNRVWNGHIGIAKGPLAVRIGAGEIPLCHLRHAAQALALAAERRPEATHIINIVDDTRPDARHYLAALRPGGWPKIVLPLSWRVLDALAAIAPAGAPGLLRRETLRSRMMPRRYDNRRAADLLGWRPTIGFASGMAEALAAEHGDAE